MSYGNYGGGEYNTTSYGPNDDGGGGFVNYGGSQGGGSQTSPASASKGRGNNTLRPVTIKQILEAYQPHPDASFKIDDAEISHITFVAKVRNVAEQSTNITYVVEDGTGLLEVKQWIDSESNAMNGVAQNLVGQYARILGQLKSFGSKRHVGAHSIRQVTDFNEVGYHLLEATLIHLQFTRGPLEQFAPAGNDATATTSYGSGRGNDTVMGGTDNTMGGGSLDSLLPANVSNGARKVLETIKAQPESNEGVHLNTISQKSKLSMNEVSKAVDELLLAGVAFTTVDENHVSIMSF